MTFTTRYNIGEEVWFDGIDGKEMKTIRRIDIDAYREGYFVWYHFSMEDGEDKMAAEHEVFRTEEELDKYCEKKRKEMKKFLEEA